MTRVVSALGALSNAGEFCEEARQYAFQSFREKWRTDANVSCTYLSLIAGLSRGVNGNASPLENVKKIANDASPTSVYKKEIPNKFYALIGGTYRTFPKSRLPVLPLTLVTVCPYVAQYNTDTFFHLS